MIAAVAVINDSAILVVGAMVVGPEFGAVAALAVGLALGRAGLSGRAILLLTKGFLVAAAGIATLLIHRTLWRWLISRTTTPHPNQSVQV